VARLTRGPLEVPLGGVDWVCADHVTCIREDSQRVGELRVVGPYGFETLHALLAGRFVQHQSRPGA
jgi:hypothetical protein